MKFNSRIVEGLFWERREGNGELGLGFSFQTAIVRSLLWVVGWNDCYGGFLAVKSSATTPFYCLKFAPFCERHSFLCIVAVCCN